MVGPEPVDPSSIRVSDAEREATAAVLQTAVSEGRLTILEFDERSKEVYAALTRGELQALTRDLPAPGQSVVAETPAADIQPRGPANLRRVVAVMSDQNETPIGKLAEKQSVQSIMGDVTLDLTQAVLPSQGLLITGTIVMGTVRLLVPDGVETRFIGTNIMSEVKTRVLAPIDETAPKVYLKLHNVMGELKIRDEKYHLSWRRKTGWWEDE